MASALRVKPRFTALAAISSPPMITAREFSAMLTGTHYHFAASWLTLRAL